MGSNFNIGYRNPGHYDIYDRVERCFAIRGEPGNVVVRDERQSTYIDNGAAVIRFKTLSTALAWCCDEMMAGDDQ